MDFVNNGEDEITRMCMSVYKVGRMDMLKALIEAMDDIGWTYIDLQFLKNRLKMEKEK
jgi:hypothetical protein